MKRYIAKNTGILLVLLVLTGCWDVAGPSPSPHYTASTIGESSSSPGYINIRAVTETISTNGDGDIVLSLTATMQYVGEESVVDVAYSVQGLSCGNSGTPVYLFDDTSRVNTGSLFYKTATYTYTDCGLVLHDEFTVDFMVLDLYTGVTVTEQINITIN